MAGRCTPGGRYPAAPDLPDRGSSPRSGTGSSPPPYATRSLPESCAALTQNRNLRAPLRKAILIHAGTLTPAEIQPHHVAAICREFQSASLAYRQTLTSLLKSLLLELGAPAHAFAGVLHCPKPKPREVTVPEEHFEAVMRQAPAWLGLTLLLAHDAGLRHDAIHRITRTQCDFEHREVTGLTKLRTVYSVPMTKRLHERLTWACAMAHDAHEPLLAVLSHSRQQPNYHTLNTALARTKKRAGVTSTWGFHDLRRTAARRLYAQTKDIRKVQRFLAHAAPGQTWWYIGNQGIALTHDDVELASQPRPEPDTKEQKRA